MGQLTDYFSFLCLEFTGSEIQECRYIKVSKKDLEAAQ